MKRHEIKPRLHQWKLLCLSSAPSLFLGNFCYLKTKVSPLFQLRHITEGTNNFYKNFINFVLFSDCTWCRDQDLATDQRCRGRGEKLPGGQCSLEEDPQSHLDILQDTEIDTSTKDNIILIQPQKVKLYLRPGDMNFTSRPEKYYILN